MKTEVIGIESARGPFELQTTLLGPMVRRNVYGQFPTGFTIKFGGEFLSLDRAWEYERLFERMGAARTCVSEERQVWDVVPEFLNLMPRITEQVVAKDDANPYFRVPAGGRYVMDEDELP